MSLIKAMRTNKWWLLVGLALGMIGLRPPVGSGIRAQDNSFVFTAHGDHGEYDKSEMLTSLSAVAQTGAAFSLALGDMNYESVGDEQRWCQTVQNALGAEYPFELVMGNHEDEDQSDGYIGNFVQHCPDRMNSQGVYGAEYYFDYPTASPFLRVIMIGAGNDWDWDGDGTLEAAEYFDYDSSTAARQAHLDWLTDAIDSARSAGIRWVAVGMHKNCITAGIKTCEIGPELMNLLVEKKVDLILQAHDHNYQRSQQLALGPRCGAIVVDGFDKDCVVDDGADGVFEKGAGSILIVTGHFGGGGFYNVSANDSEKGYFARAMGGNGWFDFLKSNKSNSGVSRGFVKFAVSKDRIIAEHVSTTNPGTAFSDVFSIVDHGFSPTATAIPSATPTPTNTPSVTPTYTPSATPSATPTSTNTPSATPTPDASLLVIESDDMRILRTGTWTAHDTALASGGRYIYSSGSLDDALTLDFQGTRVDVIYVRHPALGALGVEVDGVLVGQVNSAAADTVFGARATVDWLSTGPHTLRVYPLNGTIAVDAFAVKALVEVLPVAPTLLSPAHNTAVNDDSPLFDWDDVPAVNNYLIQLDTVAAFSSANKVEGYSNTSDFIPAEPLPGCGLWHWRVRAYDSAGHVSAWSAAWSLYIECPPPPLPLLSPADGTRIGDNTPTFEWSAQLGANLYQLQVDNDADFSSPRVNAHRTNTIFTVPPTLPLGSKDWHWRVRARGTDGIWGAWSNVWTLTVDTLKPAPPTLVSPTYNETVHNARPPFMWTGPADGAAYRIQIDTNPLFNTPNRIDVDGLWATTYIPTADLFDGVWHWRVRSYDAAGNWSPWSAAFKVFIDAVVTPIPTLLSPAHLTLTNDNTPTFEWSAQLGANLYQLQVDNDADFSSPRINTNRTNTVFTVPPTLPLGSKDWHWRVRARGTDGIWGAWSAPAWTLTVDTVKPAAPTLLAPAHRDVFASGDVPLTWNPVGDAVGYVVQVDTSRDFNTANRIQVDVAGTTYTPLTLPNGITFWRVRARDAAGNLSAWSEIHRFDISGVNPGDTATYIEADTPQVAKTGQWTRYALAGARGGDALTNLNTPNDTLELVFTGAQIEVLYVQHTMLGRFDLLIDGAVVQTVKSNGPLNPALRAVIPVPAGTHTLRIVPYARIAIDGFEIAP